ncbi:MAG TPA: MBL fold metallo-hydrolase, partial [Bacteroidales bacterium]|nr:MBL fold metallo-hydrolase [Bacteroidales bacterium]
MNTIVPPEFFTLSLGITKCFLIPCESGYLLIDTSTRNTYKKFKKELKKLAVKVSQIKYVFLTH